MKTGQLIKELRLKNGMTQQDLAERTSISARTIQRIENNEVDPRAYSLKAIASALNVNIEELTACETENSAENTTDGRNIWLPLLHASGLFLLLIPPVIIWLWKKDRITTVKEQGIDVINFQLTMLMYVIPCALFAFLIIPILVIVSLGIFSTAVIILNTIKVVNNQPYKYPMSLRILKP